MFEPSVITNQFEFFDIHSPYIVQGGSGPAPYGAGLVPNRMVREVRVPLGAPKEILPKEKTQKF